MLELSSLGKVGLLPGWFNIDGSRIDYRSGNDSRTPQVQDLLLSAN